MVFDISFVLGGCFQICWFCNNSWHDPFPSSLCVDHLGDSYYNTAFSVFFVLQVFTKCLVGIYSTTPHFLTIWVIQLANTSSCIATKTEHISWATLECHLNTSYHVILLPNYGWMFTITFSKIYNRNQLACKYNRSPIC